MGSNPYAISLHVWKSWRGRGSLEAIASLDGQIMKKIRLIDRKRFIPHPKGGLLFRLLATKRLQYCCFHSTRTSITPPKNSGRAQHACRKQHRPAMKLDWRGCWLNGPKVIERPCTVGSHCGRLLNKIRKPMRSFCWNTEQVLTQDSTGCLSFGWQYHVSVRGIIENIEFNKEDPFL